ncbi:MAG: hypothetical protein LUM44_17715 [Pyrinomonadaceae bacterium]|nr:hypothetical protein [Pyrinomonadaceae bacterium]
MNINRETVRFEISKSENYTRIVRIEELKLKDGSIEEMAYGMNFAEDGANFPNWGGQAEEIASLLNDGLKFRGQFKDESS